MNVSECLCCFAMRQVVGEGAEGAFKLLGDAFSDRSQALTHALKKSSERAWKALEVALAGEGLFSAFNSASEKALRAQVKAFVESVPLPDTTARPNLKKLILAEIRDAGKHGLLTAGLEPEAMAKEVGAFAAFSSPQDIVDAEKRLMMGMARTMQKAGYEKLAWLLAQPAHAGQSVLVAAAQFYFRREVEKDERLAHTLHLTALEGLAASQATAFEGVGAALDSHAERMESVLSMLHAEVLSAIGGVQDEVKAVGSQLEEVKALQGQVLDLVRKLDLKGQPLRPGHSLSIRNDRELAAVKEMLRRFRGLPMSEQDAHPELVSDLGKLQVAAGDFQGAREAFTRAARLSANDADRAEAHFNSYRAALEHGETDGALMALTKAMALDPERFAPFPIDKYEPLRVLGAGGFGVTFLCRHKLSKGQVAVKSLFTEELDRDVAKVLEEATTLDHLKHRGIVGLRDCGYVDRAQTRPYLVMEFFDGATLEDHVKRVGTVGPESAMELAERIAEALQAAHGMSILHRDIKPANVLVRWDKGVLEARVIDFGLALKSERLESAASTLRHDKSITGQSIAGTLGYAAPEQLGRLPGTRVGPQADVFGFGENAGVRAVRHHGAWLAALAQAAGSLRRAAQPVHGPDADRQAAQLRRGAGRIEGVPRAGPRRGAARAPGGADGASRGDGRPGGRGAAGASAAAARGSPRLRRPSRQGPRPRQGPRFRPPAPSRLRGRLRRLPPPAARADLVRDEALARDPGVPPRDPRSPQVRTGQRLGGRDAAPAAVLHLRRRRHRAVADQPHRGDPLPDEIGRDVLGRLLPPQAAVVLTRSSGRAGDWSIPQPRMRTDHESRKRCASGTMRSPASSITR